MIRAMTAGAIAVALLVQAPPPQDPATLLTIPQRDAWRSLTSPASAGVSGDGRYVAFVSYAALVAADTNRGPDVYVLDRTTDRVTVESVTGDERTLEGDSGYPRLSGDGRYLVYETGATGGDGLKVRTEVILRDRMRNTVTVASGNHPGHALASSRNPAISEDGRIVVFTSTATDLVPGPDANGTGEDVYLFDAVSGTLRRVSVDSHGAQHEKGASFAPAISPDGQYVAFTATADLEGDAGAVPETWGPTGRPISHVYVRDLARAVTTRVSVTSRGTSPDGPSYAPAISRDGRFVAFVSEAPNLVDGDRNRSPDVFVRDMRERSTVLISRRATGGSANGQSGNPAISADGGLVAFQSAASDLICARRCPAALEDLNLLSDVFLYDRANGRMTWISTGAAGGWPEESTAPQLDARGEVLAFTSRHLMDARDLQNDFDLFVRVRQPDGEPAAGDPGLHVPHAGGF